MHPIFGDRLQARDTGPLEIVLSSAIADLPFPATVRERAVQAMTSSPEFLRLKTLSEHIETLLTSMLPRTKPSIDRLAAAAGTSVRTLRRRLRAESESYEGILERARLHLAVRRLQDGDPPSLLLLARELGYADQATLTRAIKRWTGMTPSELRRNL